MRVGIDSFRRERGSTLIEFTLTLLPLLALLMLTVDLAWVLFAWACVQEGTREGVRFAVTCQAKPDIINKVQQYSFGFVSPSNVSVQYSSQSAPMTPVNCGSHCAGYVVQVSVTGIGVSPLAPIWRSNSPIILGAASSDIVESNSNCQ